ncbi:MAG TPA: site-specific integrase [Bacteroidales bacterium]|nr:site-specific integrase [Bacteroidales bacterium]
MKVHLRERKLTQSGRISLYLEYYKGSKKIDGKIKHEREFENLDMYLHLNPKTPFEKKHNKEIKLFAERIKTKRQSEYDHGKYGFASNTRLNTSFFAYYEKMMEERKESDGNYGNWESNFKHLRTYCPNDIAFRDIDEEFVKGYRNYLDKEAKTKSDTNLSQNSKVSYFNKLRACLNHAFENNIIQVNPAKKVKGFKAEETKREYLTFEELQAMANAECPFPIMKQAFLFGCLTGLRWSDIQKLIWEEVRDEETGSRIVFRQKKTDGMEYLDISNQARQLLGKREANSERVFKGLKYSANHNAGLLKWAMKAGITKHITFHSSRHTHAVLLLENGADIYTVQKRLGHKELRTTEIYADILDKKLKEAANIIPEIQL